MWWLTPKKKFPLFSFLFEILGYKKLFARWVPKSLTLEYRQNCIFATHRFLERYEKKGNAYRGLINCYRTQNCGVFQCACVKKTVSTVAHQPKSSKSSLQQGRLLHLSLSIGKAVILAVILSDGTAINAVLYCNTLKRSHKIKNEKGEECWLVVCHSFIATLNPYFQAHLTPVIIWMEHYESPTLRYRPGTLRLPSLRQSEGYLG